MSSVVVESDVQLSLDSIRESLVRQEDTVVFSLIERAKFPLNSPAFEEPRCLDSGNSSSLTEFFVREIETIQAKVVRFTPQFKPHPCSKKKKLVTEIITASFSLSIITELLS